MKKKSLFMFAAMCLLAMAIQITSCKKEDPDAPVVSLTATEFTGKTGETASTTASVVADGGLTTFRVTKFIGTTIDNTYGTNGTMEISGSSFTLQYELNEEGVLEPIRFNFTATDENGKTGSADFIITTELSFRFLLLNYDWRWHSKRGRIFEEDVESEQICPCEQDNIYSFNANGTMSIDYGALTGSGGCTCDFDGFRVEETWALNAAETELTIFAVNVFDPSDVDAQVYRITGFNLMEIRSEQTVDLSVFGGIVWDWKFVWRAVAK